MAKLPLHFGRKESGIATPRTGIEELDVTMPLLTLAGVAFLLTLTCMSLIRPVLSRLGAIDVPNHRSSHTVPVVRGAGIALIVPLLVSTLVMAAIAEGLNAESFVIVPLAMALTAAAVGAIEDLKGIAARHRFLLQLGIGAAGTYVLVSITSASLWWIPIGAIVTATYINAANFMDGINGISGLHGLASGGVYAAIGVITHMGWMTFCGLLIAIMFTTFLPWNLLGGGMFLGDAGSYLLGCFIAATAVAGLLTGTHPLALLGPTVIYFADVGTTLIRRIYAGESWTQAHRTHIYQRLTDFTLTHVQVAGFVTTLTIGTGIAGLLALGGGLSRTFIAITLMGALAIAYIASPKLVAKALSRRSHIVRTPHKEDE